MDIGLLTTCAVGGVAWGAGFAAGFKAAGKKEHEADEFAAPFGVVLPVCFHVLPGVAGELVGAGVDACGGVGVHVAGGGADDCGGGEEELRQLPAALAAPVCIAVSDTRGCLEVITEMKEGEHNVLVAVQLDSEHSSLYKVKVNRIASMYGKERIGALLNHPMLYWDKAKARPWVNNYRLQLPAPIQPRRASERRIQTPADLAKYKIERGLSFSLSGPSVLPTLSAWPSVPRLRLASACWPKRRRRRSSWMLRWRL